MVLSRTRMQKIIEELRGVIDKDINIMNIEGEIIASSNPDRIGMLHEGAKKLVNQKMDELLIGDNIDFEGAKPGINLPIYINDEITGVVGITGVREEVEPFGKIIKKMTEIMIDEEYKKDQQQLEEKAKHNFVYSWLFESLLEDEKESKSIESRGQLLGIEVSLDRAVVVLEIEDLNLKHRTDVDKQRLQNRVIKRIQKYLEIDEQNVVVQIRNRVVILLHVETMEDAQSKMLLLKDQIDKHYNVMISGGIGLVGKDAVEMRKSYKEADTLCEIISNLKIKSIKVHGDVDIELLVHTISKKYQDTFFNKIFHDCTKKEIENHIQLLKVLVENNGSIAATANQYYVHKNTVQYRLMKLKEQTGYDPRIMKELIPLYVAMLIYEEN